MNEILEREKLTAGMHISYWTESVVAPVRFESLKENMQTDVVVVGGGIAGITIAYCLLQAGKKVALVEDGYIGSGETGRTSAHLVTALDNRYYELERIYGEEKIQLIAQSHRTAIDFIESTIRREHIDCDFERVNGYLFLHPSDHEDSLDKELAASLKAGLPVEKINSVPGMRNGNQSCLRFADQAQFHPLLYLHGLCRTIEKSGGRIFTETHARDINHEGIVTDKGYRITADHIVIATNSPVNDVYTMHLKQFAYRTYVIGALIPKDSVKRALWWDTGDFTINSNLPPYHYVRIHSFDEQNDLLLSGGEDHATGLADAQDIPEEKRYDNLEQWTRTQFPITKVVYCWSGQVMEPMDSLAYIGRNPWDKNNVYIVTGDSGNGMTHGTIAGLLITDLINGTENKWEKLYGPSRFKFMKSGKTFLKEFLGGFLSYLKKYPGNADAINLSSINQDTGKIMEFGGKKFGVYRDYDDRYHLVSAECTHLKCIVKWNNDEKSWDCPCHGSRFTFDGKVINGPANEELIYHIEEREFVEVLKESNP